MVVKLSMQSGFLTLTMKKNQQRARAKAETMWEHLSPFLPICFSASDWGRNATVPCIKMEDSKGVQWKVDKSVREVSSVLSRTAESNLRHPETEVPGVQWVLAVKSILWFLHVLTWAFEWSFWVSPFEFLDENPWFYPKCGWWESKIQPQWYTHKWGSVTAWGTAWVPCLQPSPRGLGPVDMK